jgi:hypothetical protein
MSSNYLTNSSGFMRITDYVGPMIDQVVDGQIEKLSQQLQSSQGQQDA